LLVSAEFAVNNKVHSATNACPLMTNYSRELRIKVNIGKKRKIEKVTKFVERIKKI